jgi:hypothetical protein
VRSARSAKAHTTYPAGCEYSLILARLAELGPAAEMDATPHIEKCCQTMLLAQAAPARPQYRPQCRSTPEVDRYHCCHMAWGGTCQSVGLTGLRTAQLALPA